MLSWIVIISLCAVTVTSTQEDPQLFSQIRWKFASSAAMSGGSGARAVAKKILSVEQAEGVGARVRRSVGGAEVMLTTPTTSSAPIYPKPDAFRGEGTV